MGSAGFWSEGAECGERLVLDLTVIVVGWCLVLCRGGVVGLALWWVLGQVRGDTEGTAAGQWTRCVCVKLMSFIRSNLSNPTTYKQTYQGCTSRSSTALGFM